MGGIFISYRREDSAGYTGRLYDHLSRHFGPERVFMDIDAIAPGEDFVEVLQRNVTSCDALVVVIGKSWLACVDQQGHRRLDDPHDFVRLEIATALDRRIPVIPTLVGGAVMPREQDLPDALILLARRQAMEISDMRFQQDCLRLIDVLAGMVNGAEGWIHPAAAAQAAVRKVADISGAWVADNPGLSFDGQCYPMRFMFKVMGDRVLGTMAYHITGETKIVDGKIDGESLAFTTKHAYVLGTDSEKHPYSFEFLGRISGDEIAFVRQGDRPGCVFKSALDEFTARRIGP
ncbi:toll/interleukin-1 receptor domain-containing protein [Nitrospira sp. NS4]|uniref:toll/interleukin-1 receptor domain-containing protein n=1 Tax=Nitrospira sp. NS4 TaxID=3414498 RepID=UPI003C2F1FAD